MAFLMALPVIFFVWTKRKIKSPFVWFSLPAYWMAYEYLQGHWDLAFMWLHIGLGFSSYPKWIQFYEITGRLGGTFLIVSVNIVFYLLLKYWKNVKYRKILLCSFTAIIITVFLTNFLLTDNRQLITDNHTKVAVIQGNMNPYETIDEQVFERQYQIIEKLTLSAMDKKPNLIVCSEGFFKGTDKNPFVLNEIDSNATIKKLKALSGKMKAPILTGIIAYKLYYTSSPPTISSQAINEKTFYDTYNAAVLISHDQPVQFYSKSRLVPFMERVPFLDKLSIMESLHLSLNKMSGSYCRTNQTNIFTYKNLKIAPVICQESLFPDYVSAFVQKGANVIAVITDDGWSGKTNGPAQHACYAAPLAIEMQRPVVRSANTGISLFIDKEGNQLNATKLDEEKIIVRNVELNSRKNFFVKYGNVLGRTSCIVSVIFLLIAYIKSKRSA